MFVALKSGALRDKKEAAEFSGLMGAVLAAGLGRRFGRPKLAVPLGGRPLLHWPVQAALDAGLAKVLVVGGPRSRWDRLLPADPRLEILRNLKPQRGMGSSLALAAQRAQELGARVLVVLLGDMPLVSAETISQVARAALTAPAGAAAARAGGRQAHPVAFAQRHLSRLGQLRGEAGGRVLLEGLKERLALVPAPDSSLLDVDTPKDLARVRELLKKPLF